MTLVKDFFVAVETEMFLSRIYEWGMKAKSLCLIAIYAMKNTKEIFYGKRFFITTIVLVVNVKV